LFDTVQVQKVNGSLPPRSFTDYQVMLAEDCVPAGVTVIERD
jgi:hypothetical protein